MQLLPTDNRVLNLLWMIFIGKTDDVSSINICLLRSCPYKWSLSRSLNSLKKEIRKGIAESRSEINFMILFLCFFYYKTMKYIHS